MLKGFLKKVFKAICDDRDTLTVANDFAKAAFKREGYVIQSCDSVEEYKEKFILEGKTVNYTLKKEQDDGKEYSGAVTGIMVATTVAHMGGVGSAVTKHAWISGAPKPKA